MLEASLYNSSISDTWPLLINSSTRALRIRRIEIERITIHCRHSFVVMVDRLTCDTCAIPIDVLAQADGNPRCPRWRFSRWSATVVSSPDASFRTRVAPCRPARPHNSLPSRTAASRVDDPPNALCASARCDRTRDRPSPDGTPPLPRFPLFLKSQRDYLSTHIRYAYSVSYYDTEYAINAKVSCSLFEINTCLLVNFLSQI